MGEFFLAEAMQFIGLTVVLGYVININHTIKILEAKQLVLFTIIENEIKKLED